MPTSDEPQPGAEPKEPEAPKAPEPAYVTRAELDGLRDTILGTVRETIAESMRLARPVDPPKSAPVIEDVTDAEIEAQLAEGKPVTHLIRKAAKAAADRAVASLRDSDVTPLRTLGTSAVRDLVMDRAYEKMPLRDNTVFQRHVKPLLDRAIGALPEEAQLSLGAIMGTYDILIGRLQRENPDVWNAIQEETREKRLRASSTQDGGQTGGTTTGRTQPGTPKARDLADIVGEGGVAALSDLGANREGRPGGKDFDTFARNLGYTPEQYRKMLEVEEKGAKLMKADEYLEAIKPEGRA
jgi:hypothetical protein